MELSGHAQLLLTPTTLLSIECPKQCSVAVNIQNDVGSLCDELLRNYQTSLTWCWKITIQVVFFVSLSTKIGYNAIRKNKLGDWICCHTVSIVIANRWNWVSSLVKLKKSCYCPSVHSFYIQRHTVLEPEPWSADVMRARKPNWAQWKPWLYRPGAEFKSGWFGSWITDGWREGKIVVLVWRQCGVLGDRWMKWAWKGGVADVQTGSSRIN